LQIATTKGGVMEQVMKLIMENIANISAFIFGIGVVGVVVAKITAIIKELAELLNTVALALADKKIDNDEIAKILQEGKDVVNSIKNLKK